MKMNANENNTSDTYTRAQAKDYDVHLVIIQMLHPDLFCLMFAERTAGVLILYAHTCVQAVSRKT